MVTFQPFNNQKQNENEAYIKSTLFNDKPATKPHKIGYYRHGKHKGCKSIGASPQLEELPLGCMSEVAKPNLLTGRMSDISNVDFLSNLEDAVKHFDTQSTVNIKFDEAEKIKN